MRNKKAKQLAAAFLAVCMMSFVGCASDDTEDNTDSGAQAPVSSGQTDESLQGTGQSSLCGMLGSRSGVLFAGSAWYVTKDDFLGTVAQWFPDVAKAQETEEEFEELIDFIKEVKWDRMGAFTYSKEEDTPAYDYPDEIDEDIQNERLSALMEIQREISLEKNKEKIGKVIEVLVEEKEGLTNRYRGRSKADAPDEVDGQVIFRCDEDLDIGSFVQVKITDAKEYDLFGIWKES